MKCFIIIESLDIFNSLHLLQKDGKLHRKPSLCCVISYWDFSLLLAERARLDGLKLPSKSHILIPCSSEQARASLEKKLFYLEVGTLSTIQIVYL